MLRIRICLAVGLLATPCFMPAAVPAPLAEALALNHNDKTTWAYTQTETPGTLTSNKKDPAPPPITVFRFDPSKPYKDQYTPIVVSGHAPTEKDVEAYRQRGIARGDRLEKAADAKDPNAEPRPKPAFSIDLGKENGRYTCNFEEATLLRETPDRLVYQAPLHDKGHAPVSGDHFAVEFEVAKADHSFKRVRIQLKKPLRMFLVLKVTDGLFDVTMDRVDAEHAPVMTSMKVAVGAKVFFKGYDLTQTQTFSDYQKVKPFGGHFGVQIGPLSSLGN